MDPTPVSLLERLRAPVAAQRDWEQLVDLCTPLLYCWARRMGAQEADVADLVQDVLMTLVRRLPDFTYDPGKSFHGWLQSLIRNRWRNHRRQQATARTVEHVVEDLVEVDNGDSLSEEEYRQHLAHRALELMKTDFQPTTWKACWATVMDNRPVTEVAAELGLSTGAVYLARFRVLSRLRQELRELWD